MASNVTLAVGQKLAEYTLEAPLGEGGMAVTWRARERLGDMAERIIALKTIKPERAQETTFRDMFFDEMRITALINHRNVCQIHRAGEVDGVLFMAMEFIDGWSVSTLRKRFEAKHGVQADVESSMWDFRPHEVRRLGFPIAPALWIAAETAAGLAAAHDLVDADGQHLQVVHRDVSPQNVMVASSGAVKLIDFGIAKANTNLVRTETGLLKGKVPYMSHEQLEGRPLDGRNDLFSLGLMLYELLTGIHPLLGSTDAATMFNYATRTIAPPSQVLPEIPAEVDAVVMGALNRDRDQRWQTGHALGRALMDALQVVHPGYREPDFVAWLASLSGRHSSPDAFAATGFIGTTGLGAGVPGDGAPRAGDPAATGPSAYDIGTSPTAAYSPVPEPTIGPEHGTAHRPAELSSPGSRVPAVVEDSSGARSWVAMVVVLLVVLLLGLVALIVLMAKRPSNTESSDPAVESAHTDTKRQPDMEDQATPPTGPTAPAPQPVVIGLLVDDVSEVPVHIVPVDPPPPVPAVPASPTETETQLIQLKNAIIPCFDMHRPGFDQAAAFLDSQPESAIETCAPTATGWLQTSPVHCTLFDRADHPDLGGIRGKLERLEVLSETADSAVRTRKAYWQDAENHTCSRGASLTSEARDALQTYLDARDGISTEIAAFDDKLDARRRRTLRRSGVESFELHLRGVASALEGYMYVHPKLGDLTVGTNERLRDRQEKTVLAMQALDGFCAQTPISPEDSLSCRVWEQWREGVGVGLDTLTVKAEQGKHMGKGPENLALGRNRELSTVFPADRVPVNVFWSFE